MQVAGDELLGMTGNHVEEWREFLGELPDEVNDVTGVYQPQMPYLPFRLHLHRLFAKSGLEMLFREHAPGVIPEAEAPDAAEVPTRTNHGAASSSSSAAGGNAGVPRYVPTDSSENILRRMRHMVRGGCNVYLTCLHSTT